MKIIIFDPVQWEIWIEFRRDLRNKKIKIINLVKIQFDHEKKQQKVE